MSQKYFKYIFIIALILSFIFHWIFYKHTVITFDIKGEPHKPNFVFLGSIFAKTEIMDGLKERSPAVINIDPSVIKLESTHRPYREMDVLKPKSDFTSSIEKKSHKMTFLNDTKNPPANEKIQPPISGIETNIQPYQTLKFQK